jgi:hypothetical protein
MDIAGLSSPLSWYLPYFPAHKMHFFPKNVT